MKVKTAIKGLVIAMAAILIILLVGWRLWPHSLAKVISVEPDAVTGLACHAAVSGIESDGRPFIHSYALQELSADEEAFGAVLELLQSSRYRQDFRNLLPWPVTSVDSGGSDDGKSANIFLVWGTSEQDTCFLSIGGGSVTVSLGSEAGLKVYHPTDSDVLSQLVDYIQLHGDLG